MSKNSSGSGDNGKRSTLLLPIIGSVVAIGLILLLGFIANRLIEIEETIAFRPPQPSGALVLPPDLVAKGRAVYVPAYAHIYRHGGEAMQLENTLSVRNTDPQNPLRIDQVRYVDTDGKPIRELADQPIVLGPLQTASYLVEKGDRSGGSGANFIVEWSAQKEINPPIIEAIMIGVDGVSFTSRGVPIARH